MNTNVHNMAMYMKANIILINNTRVNAEIYQDNEGGIGGITKAKTHSFIKVLDNTESFIANSGKIHMYQKDISG